MHYTITYLRRVAPDTYSHGQFEMRHLDRVREVIPGLMHLLDRRELRDIAVWRVHPEGRIARLDLKTLMR